MKKSLIFVLLVISVFLFLPTVNASKEITVHLFYSETCPHCKKEKEFLNTLTERYNNIKIELYELTDENNSSLYDSIREIFGITKSYVPLTIIGTVDYTGFNGDIAASIENTINYYEGNDYFDLVVSVKNNEFIAGIDTVEKDIIEKEMIKIPIIGEINPKVFSLPVIAIVIGIVDGFNPCAMWVLLFLISMLIGMKNKARMWIIGLTFLITSALIYMLFMFTWLQVSLSIIAINWVKILIGLFAIVSGIYSFSKFIQTNKKNVGCTVVEKEKRNNIFNKIKKYTAEKNLFIALIGVAVLAISVNVIELACSAGLPLLFTQILAVNNLSEFQHVTYILIYILFFLIDDIIIFVIAMLTLEKVGISNKYNKYSSLIGGIIMIIIGLLLIFNPSLLTFS